MRVTGHVTGVMLLRGETRVILEVLTLLRGRIVTRSRVAVVVHVTGVSGSLGESGRTRRTSIIRGDRQRLAVLEALQSTGGPVLLSGLLIKAGDDRRAPGDPRDRLFLLPDAALSVAAESITITIATAVSRGHLGRLGNGGSLDAVEVDAAGARVGPGLAGGLSPFLVPQLSTGQLPVRIVHLGNALRGDGVGIGDAGRTLGRKGPPLDIGPTQLEINEEQEGSREHEQAAQGQTAVEVPGRLDLPRPADGQGRGLGLAVGQRHDDDLLVEVLARQQLAIGGLGGVEGD